MSLSRYYTIRAVVLVTACWAGSAAAGFFTDLLPFGKDEQKVVLLFVDNSGSISSEDWDNYEKSYRKVVSSLESGDHLLVATISEHTLTRFQPVIDMKIKKTGIKFTDEENRLVAKKKLENMFAEVKSSKPARRTHIMDALNVSAEVFAVMGDIPVKWVVILSDMVEESDAADFMKDKVTDEYGDKVIEKRRSQQLVPNLSGVRVYVAGATAQSTLNYYQNKKFWTRYFRETGAVCEEGMYGRGVLEFK